MGRFAGALRIGGAVRDGDLARPPPMASCFPQVKQRERGKNNARLAIGWRSPSASVLVKLKAVDDLWSKAGH